MSGFQEFVKRNIVAIVMVPSIIGIHWGWSAMQENRSLVSKEEQIDLPVVTLAKYFWHRVSGKDEKTVNSPASPAASR